MKLIMICLLFVVAGCAEKTASVPVTNEDKAKKAIADAIAATVPHPESYQPVSFGTLDSLFTEPDGDSTEYYLGRADAYIELATKYLASDYKRSSMYSDSSIYFSKKATAYVKEFSREFTGWKMEHTYQASNSANLMTKASVTVYFDRSLSIVKIE